MLPLVHWDINITTLLVFLSSCFAFYVGVLRTGDRTKSNASKIDDLAKDLDGVRVMQLAIKADHDILKDELHKDYAKAETVDGLMRDVFDTIRKEGDRTVAAINRLDDRIVALMRDPADRPSPR